MEKKKDGKGGKVLTEKQIMQLVKTGKVSKDKKTKKGK